MTNSIENTKKQPALEELQLIKIRALASMLHSAYSAHVALGPEPLPKLEEKSGLVETYKDIVQERVPEELRELVFRDLKNLEKIVDPKADPGDVFDNVKSVIENTKDRYIDRNKHISGLFTREFIVDKLGDILNDLFKNEITEIEDLQKVAVIFFDLNGLKALNDGGVGKHAAGDQALQIFSNILKDGETTSWLKDQGVKVIPARQSGDEFLLLVQGNKDLREILEEARQRYYEEVKNSNASHLFDFETAKKYLSGLGLYDQFVKNLSEKREAGLEDIEEELSKKFKFQLGSSFGASTLGEALSKISLDEVINPKDPPAKQILFKNATYGEKIAFVRGKMFGVADDKSEVHKKTVKAKAAEADPLLGLLQDRKVADPEKLGLQSKNKDLEEENRKLKTEKEELERKIEELKAQIAQK